jgi:hypothetical protein
MELSKCVLNNAEVMRNFNEIVSRDKYLFKAYNIKKILSAHALLVFFTIFCFLLDEKSNFEITVLTNFENSFSNPLHRPLKRRF